MAFKILIVDPIHIKLKNYLVKNFIVTIKQPITQKKLMECIVDYDILVLRSGAKVDSSLLDRAINLKIIIRAGTGTDNIDITTIREKEVIFYNTPNTNSRSVAEMSFGFMHCLYRHIKRASVEIESNMWNKKSFQGLELSEKNLGLIGFGSIGKEIACIAKGYNMNVSCIVSNYSQERASSLLKKNVTLLEKLDDLITLSDILVICCPYNESTKDLMNLENMKNMHPDSILINIARGGIVVEEDLYQMLLNKKIYGAASDVFRQERNLSPLFSLNNFIGTPHIGAMTNESQEKIADLIISFLEKERNETLFS
ncbi:NAD(P)-dependent oxidoreductase [Photorhabdus heterorhabditis]|uniref:NAD(P)-dependent oxidoreductase n=1 Tax=Photorhabdus heterorhabditis TaxID=880156 RepID=UPI0006C86BF5|nr:NAD(P)-dependent oxidoreductase [Photorhabdus heterorhabditis]